MSGKPFISTGLERVHISLVKSSIRGFDILVSTGLSFENNAWIRIDDVRMLGDLYICLDIIRDHLSEMGVTLYKADEYSSEYDSDLEMDDE